jgi:hypothetical protein
MWFIIIVLLISIILDKASREKETDIAEYDVQDRVVHPAEYLMR